MVVIDKGRAIDERCVILIEDDEFKGFGYVNLNHQINTIEILRSLIRPMKNNRDARHIIQQYLRKSKSLKIIKLNPQSKQ
jgi:DNA polymerase-3 subunit epsilon